MNDDEEAQVRPRCLRCASLRSANVTGAAYLCLPVPMPLFLATIANL